MNAILFLLAALALILVVSFIGLVCATSQLVRQVRTNWRIHSAASRRKE